MNLRKHADSIPELGGGGRTCGDRLIELAAAVPSGQAIVEIAPWFGSASAYLALGIMQGGHDVALHAFDRWVIDEHWQEKARIHNELEFPIGTDLEPRWLHNMEPFLIKCYPHKGDIRKAKWNGEPIGLLVDDISNTKSLINSTMRIFGPSIVPGAKVVLMDWQFFLGPQEEFMRDNCDAFAYEECLPRPSMAAIFSRLEEDIVCE